MFVLERGHSQHLHVHTLSVAVPPSPRVWSSTERLRQDKPANHDLFTTVSFVEKKTGAGKMAQW